MNVREMLDQALRVWGFESQLTKLAEESGELIASINRYFLGTGTLEDVYEEMVGVRSVIDSLDLAMEEEITRSEMKRIREEQYRKLSEALREEGDES